MPVVSRAPCPSHLQGEARKIWQRTARRLIAMNVLTDADLDMLGDYCAARAEFLRLDRYVRENLDALRNSPNFPTAVAMRNQAREAMKKLAEQFGLTPSSRTRLRIEPPAVASDPMEEFFTNSG